MVLNGHRVYCEILHAVQRTGRTENSPTSIIVAIYMLFCCCILRFRPLFQLLIQVSKEAIPGGMLGPCGDSLLMVEGIACVICG